MTASPTAAQLRRWSEQVAKDPGSLSFLPLAETYRARGFRDAAMRLCLRGLERHPHHVAAHHLLGLLYHDSGDHVRAFDEWDIALRLDPEHQGARRELGMLCFERQDWEAACRHLEPAAVADTSDNEVASALAVARDRLARSGAAETAASPREAGDDASALRLREFAREPGVLGAVLLDSQGLVLAGEVQRGGADRAPVIAATLRGVAEDAEHAVRHLGMHRWNGILIESPEAVVHLAPVSDSVLAVATTREAPMGWTLRLAARIRRAAVRLLDPDAEDAWR